MAQKPQEYAADLERQIAMKSSRKLTDKITDRLNDFGHLDTVTNYSPFGKSAIAKEIGSLSPVRTLLPQLSLPVLNPLSSDSLQASLRLQAQSPFVKAGLSTLTPTIGSTVLPPPVPLVPPSIFTHSVAGLHGDAYLNEAYLRRYGLHGSPSRYGRSRGAGLNQLTAADMIDDNKLKKALYRNALLDQMDDNTHRKIDKYHWERVENALDDERIRRDRYIQDGRRYHWGDDPYAYGRRKGDYGWWNEHGHYPQRARYSRRRGYRGAGNGYPYDSVEAYWHDRGYQGPNYPDYRNYRVNSRWKKGRHQWWDEFDYPYGSIYDSDWWLQGLKEAPWKKEPGYWHQGRFFPEDIAKTIRDKVGKEADKLRGEVTEVELDMQKQLNGMKKVARDADLERGEILGTLKHLRERMTDQQITDDVKHNYVYNYLTESGKHGLMNGQEGLISNSMSALDQLKYKIPTRPDRNTKETVDSSLKFVDEFNKDKTAEKFKEQVKLFDAQYFNQVNSKRLDDLKPLSKSVKLSNLDVKDFLERETGEQSLKLHDKDTQNFIMNKDILKDGDYGLPAFSNYEQPLKISDKFNKEFPQMDSVVRPQSKQTKAPFYERTLAKARSLIKT